MTFEERVQELKRLQALHNDSNVDKEALEDHIDCEASNLMFSDEDIEHIFDDECYSSLQEGESNNSNKENKDQ
tara:strand:- start:277 stop:495 length:219 start_codon:yes stop_codon:yes gene_type:complete